MDLCRQPRRLRAFGSLSRAFTAHQGILAGCNYATGMLFLLTLRAVRRLNSILPCVTPRALVDDISLQFISSSERGIPQLERAVRHFSADAFPLGLWT